MKSGTQQVGDSTETGGCLNGTPPPQSTLSPRGEWILTDRARLTQRREMEWVIATAQRFLENGGGREKRSNPEAQNSRAVRRASPKGEKDLREENVPQWLTATISAPQQAPTGNSRAPPQREYCSLITLRETELLTSKKRSSIYEAIAAGTFPKQVKLGGAGVGAADGHVRKIAFIYGEVIDWIRVRIAQRDLENAGSKRP